MPKPANLPPSIDWNKLVSDGLNAFHDGVGLALTIGGWVAIAGGLLVLIIAPSKVGKVE
jgi:hypothetical protein